MLFPLMVLFFSYTAGASSPVVQTSLGLIEGYHKQSYNGRTYSAFEGIPYAKPPVGYLRFKDPVRPRSWETWIANTTHTCLQVSFLSGQVVGSEDCLYLNVYTPKESPSPFDNLEVVVHIHGGAFMFGSSSLAGPKYLMDRDVVYVNLNYRLGVFGFLSTEDAAAPGNFGMKDQVLALQWIQTHISKFGGNPNSVTLAGLSAGGGSSHLHYFSNLSRGLFHRGISHSGNALAPWALQEGALEKARKIASLVGCNNPSTDEFISCMKQRSALQILKNIKYLYPYPGFPLVLFAPVVEPKSHNAFLDEYPYELLKNGNFIDVPWITSVVSAEGSIGLIMFLNDLTRINREFNDNAQYILDYNYTVCDSDKRAVAGSLRRQYFENISTTLATTQSFVKVVGDRYVVNSFEKSARIQASKAKSPVYTYLYEYKNSFIDEHSKHMGLAQSFGVGHGEDCQLIYSINFEGVAFENANLTTNDVLIKDTMLDMITSFAKTGIPKVKGVDWNPVNESDKFSYLYIENPTHIQMKTQEELSPTKFWASLPILENEKVGTYSCTAGKMKRK